MNDFDTLKEFLPLLIPYIILELTLLTIALVHILRHRKYKVGNMPIWIVIVVLMQLIGPVAYFIIGRSDEDASGGENEE